MPFGTVAFRKVAPMEMGDIEVLFTLHGAIILNLLHDLFFLREKQKHREINTTCHTKSLQTICLNCQKLDNRTGWSRTSAYRLHGTRGDTAGRA